MGLDQYIYKISKPNNIYNTDHVYDYYNDINANEHIMIPAKDCNESFAKSLIPYCCTIKARTNFIDYNALYEDYGLNKNQIFIRCGREYETYTDNNKTVDILVSTIKERYTKTEVEDYYICKCEEIKYWRKEYDIQKWFHNNLGRYYETDIANCGYYVIPEFLIKQFDKDQLDHPFESYKYTNEFEMLPINITNDTSALVYFEWY